MLEIRDRDPRSGRQQGGCQHCCGRSSIRRYDYARQQFDRTWRLPDTHDLESNLSTVAAVADRTSQAAVDAKTASSDVALRTAELRRVIGGFLEKVAA
ncbi:MULTISPECIES: hypothetical protein [unclassified Bradyrhizobium]|uniref:hypothetical protein n=1 Tax=Bradyrhizobium sp. LCT2 TaxID=2493093 RepID=UPI00192A3824|nr:hypothetical protein [Bradyrhizobium sp. LCT2]